MILKPKIETGAGAGMELLEVALRNPAHFGKTIGEVMSGLPAGAHIVALRRAHHNEPASPGSSWRRTTSCWSSRQPRRRSPRRVALLDEPAPGRLVKDRSDLDYVRVFASRPMVVGRAIGDLELPGDKAAIIGHVRRGDTDIMPRPDLVLEFGDRVGLLANRGDFAGLRKFFGDSIKGTAEFSYISIGLGMAIGFLIGAIQLPVPGIGKLAIGLVGRADRGAGAGQSAAHRRA